MDEQGRVLSDVTTAALMMELALRAHEGHTVSAPITMPNAFEVIATWHGSRLVRTGTSVQGLPNVSPADYPLLAFDGTGNFIFPQFQPVVDGMFATAKLLEYLAKRRMGVSQVVNYLPPIYMAGGVIPCPWDQRGMVMRQLHEQHHHHHLDKLDGVKIYLEDKRWVHLSPHPDKPQFNILAEAETTAEAQQIVQHYTGLVEEWIRQ